MKFLAMLTLVLFQQAWAQSTQWPLINISGTGYEGNMVTAHVVLKATNTYDDRCVNIVDNYGETFRHPHVFHLTAYSWVDFENVYFLDINVDTRLADDVRRQRKAGVLENTKLSVNEYLNLCRPKITQLSVNHKDSQLMIRNTPNATFKTYFLVEYGTTEVYDYSFSLAPRFIGFSINFHE